MNNQEIKAEIEKTQNILSELQDKLKDNEMEFDFVKWYNGNGETETVYGVDQNIIDANDTFVCYASTRECQNVVNRIAVERIITWYIAQYIEKYDKGWKPDWSEGENNYYFEKSYIADSVYIDFISSYQNQPNQFYFSEKVKHHIKNLPQQLKDKYGFYLFDYYLTGEK